LPAYLLRSGWFCWPRKLPFEKHRAPAEQSYLCGARHRDRARWGGG